MITKEEKKSLDEAVLIIKDIANKMNSHRQPFDELAFNLECISEKMKEVYYV